MLACLQTMCVSLWQSTCTAACATSAQRCVTLAMHSHLQLLLVSVTCM